MLDFEQKLAIPNIFPPLRVVGGFVKKKLDRYANTSGTDWLYLVLTQMEEEKLGGDGILLDKYIHIEREGECHIPLGKTKIF